MLYQRSPQKPGAAEHRARRDRRAGVGEGELEQEERQRRDAGASRRCPAMLLEEVPVCRSPIAVADAGRCREPNIQAKPEGPEEDAAEAGVDDALEEHVDRFPGAGEARLQEHEARLLDNWVCAARTSSGRLMGVVCGASCSRSAGSSVMRNSVSAKASSVSLLSVSVGSIIIASLHDRRKINRRGVEAVVQAAAWRCPWPRCRARP